MTYVPPGSAELRALVAPFVLQGAYPPARTMTEDDVNRLSPCAKNRLVKLRELTIKETKLDRGDYPTKGTPWEKIRIEIRDLVQAILIGSPELIAVETVQLHGIEKGALPDPDKEESGMKYFRLPDWNFACWTCGTPVAGVLVAHSVHVKGMHGAGTGEVRSETVLHCPHCEKKPSPHGTPVYI